MQRKTLFVVRVFHDGRSIELCFFGIQCRNNDSNKSVMGFAEAEDPRKIRIFSMYTGMQREQHESARHTPTTILSSNRRSLIIVFAKEIQRNDQTEGSIEQQGFKQWKLLLLYSLGIVRSTCPRVRHGRGVPKQAEWISGRFRERLGTLIDLHLDRLWGKIEQWPRYNEATGSIGSTGRFRYHGYFRFSYYHRFDQLLIYAHQVSMKTTHLG